jgi:hypothetical protein
MHDPRQTLEIELQEIPDQALALVVGGGSSNVIAPVDDP